MAAVQENHVITEGPSFCKRFPDVPQSVAMHTVIGGRKSQEDRFAICPKLCPHENNCCFYGVFDGTVGDFASNTVKDLVVPFLRDSPSLRELEQNNGELSAEDKMALLKKAMKHMYQKSDEELLRRCGIEQKHYAASTSVTLLLWQDLICVGHLGDSRICLIYITEQQLRSFQGVPAISGDEEALNSNGEGGGAVVAAATTNNENSNAANDENNLASVMNADGSKKESFAPKVLDSRFTQKGAIRVDSIPLSKVDEIIEGNFVTNDHKPDHHDERQRIEASGGSVEYLHNHQNKPFIRGGDFQQRKLLGESPMQLQYSRAFGGKDLKPFGLIADPTINITRRERQFVGFVLASDGLWDILSADAAARVATRAYLKKENPAEALVNAALHGSCDNITAVTIFYDSMGGSR